MRAHLLRDGLKTAHVTPVSAEDIVTAPCQLQSFDLLSMTPQDADFNAQFTLQAPSSVCNAPPPLGSATQAVGAQLLLVCLVPN